jgi:hypothetical protein
MTTPQKPLKPEGKSMIHDESGKMSAGRVLAFFWTLYIAGYMWLRPDVSGAMLTVFLSVETALIAWNAGGRVARYIMPSVKQAISNIATLVRKDRDPEQGIEPTPS